MERNWQNIKLQPVMKKELLYHWSIRKTPKLTQKMGENRDHKI
jgi:hypothetical protein